MPKNQVKWKPRKKEPKNSIAVDRTSNFLSFFISSLFNIMKHAAALVFTQHMRYSSTLQRALFIFIGKKPIRTRKAEWVVEMKFRSHPGRCRFLLISRVNTNNFGVHTTRKLIQVLHICGQISNIDSLVSRILFVLASLIKPASPCHAWNKHEAQKMILSAQRGGAPLISTFGKKRRGRAAKLRASCSFAKVQLSQLQVEFSRRRRHIINVNCCFSCSVSLAHYARTHK